MLKNNIQNRFLVELIYLAVALSVAVQFFGSLVCLSNGSYDSCKVLFFNLYIAWALLVCYTIFHNFYGDFLLFTFYICFFIFLMGQKVFYYIDEGVFYETYTFVLMKMTPSQYVLFNNLIYIALVGSFVGYVCWRKMPKQVVTTSPTPKERVNDANEIFILRLLVYVTFAMSMVMNLMIIKAKTDEGYLGGYLINVDIPNILKIGNYLFLGFALLFLAKKTSKLDMWIVMAMFFIIQGGMNLLAGRRIMFVQTVLFFIWYVIMYKKYYLKRLKLRYLVLLVAFGVAMMLFLYFIEAVRENKENTNGIWGVLKKFMTSTGGSDSVIANTIDKKEYFSKSPLVYFFAPLVETFTANPVIRKAGEFFGLPPYVAYPQGLEHLAQTNSFSHWISYIVSPDLYLKGHGMGTSYIAELWFAFGVGGVLVASLLLGVIVKQISRLDKSDNMYKNALKMFFAYQLLSLPRSSTLGWTSGLLYVGISFAIFKCLSWLFTYSKTALQIEKVEYERGK